MIQSGQKFLHTNLPVIGCDEAGRGPWAGPLVVAAAIIPKSTKLPGLDDSKALSENARTKLFNKITQKCQFAYVVVSNETIDKIGLGPSLRLAFGEVINRLRSKDEPVLIDGNTTFGIPQPVTKIIKGDSRIREIAAASIIAKVVRDTLMSEIYAKQFPKYLFGQHKGYGTRLHQQLLLSHRPSPIHRKSFKPIADLS